MMIQIIWCFFMLFSSFSSFSAPGSYEHFESFNELHDNDRITAAVTAYRSARGSYEDFVISALHDEDSESPAAYSLAAYIWSGAIRDDIRMDFKDSKLTAIIELLSRLTGFEPTSEFTDETRGFGESMGASILGILKGDDSHDEDDDAARTERNREALRNLLSTQIKIAP